jgi:hypothetical protein
MSDQSLPPELAAFEARLAALAPQAGGLDRDELMYRAGWAAAEAALVAQAAETAHQVELAARERAAPPERAWVWRTATLVLALIVLAFVVVHLAPRTPEVVQPQPPTQQKNLAAGPADPPADSPHGEYLRLRELVIEKGLEGLGSPTSVTTSSDPPATNDYRQLRRDLLGT